MTFSLTPAVKNLLRGSLYTCRTLVVSHSLLRELGHVRPLKVPVEEVQRTLSEFSDGRRDVDRMVGSVLIFAAEQHRRTQTVTSLFALFDVLSQIC